MKRTKSDLDTFRQANESYDTIIRKLVFLVKHKRLKAQLKEAYLRMGRESLDVLEEWEPASHEIDHA